MKSKMQEAIDHAQGILKHHLPENLKFHNLSHTLEVVAGVQEIGRQCKIKPEEMEMVTLGAWYHDAGFCRSYRNHEHESVEIAFEFLDKIGYPSDVTKVILDCIKATQLP